MAKFNECTQKSTPEDADKLMIYDAAAKANKLSPFSGIWNWIVGKLTNAVISNLQTSNKSVIGALNELNSNLTKLSEIKVSSTSYDVPQRTEQTFTPMELSAGTWLIIGHCSSNAPNAGIYNFGINSRMVRANNQNGGGCINAMLIVFDKETSVRLNLYQDATTTLKMNVYLQAIRLG